MYIPSHAQVCGAGGNRRIHSRRIARGEHDTKFASVLLAPHLFSFLFFHALCSLIFLFFFSSSFHFSLQYTYLTETPQLLDAREQTKKSFHLLNLHHVETLSKEK